MSWLAKFALSVLHFLYVYVTIVISWRARLVSPRSERTRTRIPSHLALLLVAEDQDDGSTALVQGCLLESLLTTTAWCHTVGIRKLTVYDRRGILSRNLEEVSRRLRTHESPSAEGDTSESDIEYPLTPPLSEASSSRPLSPIEDYAIDMNVSTLEYPNIRSRISKKSGRATGVQRRRKEPKIIIEPSPPLIIHVISRPAGKPSIARAASILLYDAKGRKLPQDGDKEFSVEGSEINSIIEGDHGFTSPDLMIVHNIFPNVKWTKRPLEFYGFPPWQMRLTEIYHSQTGWRWWKGTKSKIPLVSLRETNLEKALDQFSLAEMRLGR